MRIVDGAGLYDERFEDIYRKSYARVWRYFRRNRIADDEAHDLCQDSFKRLFERMNQIRNEDPWPFLATIAKTILLNRVRARQTQKRNAPIVEIDDPELMFAEPAAPAEPDYADRQAEETRRTQVRAAVAALPPGQRECLRLSIQGFKYDEITKILGISLDAVRSRLRDAKRALRRQLGEKS
jgi:RNA polymerase sigma-70 factor (ECF subfamily)